VAINFKHDLNLPADFFGFPLYRYVVFTVLELLFFSSIIPGKNMSYNALKYHLISSNSPQRPNLAFLDRHLLSGQFFLNQRGARAKKKH